MIIEKLLKATPWKRDRALLLVGAMATALLISLGMVGVLSLLRYPVNPALPATFGAIGAALFSARLRRRRNGDD